MTLALRSKLAFFKAITRANSKQFGWHATHNPNLANQFLAQARDKLALADRIEDEY